MFQLNFFDYIYRAPSLVVAEESRTFVIIRLTDIVLPKLCLNQATPTFNIPKTFDHTWFRFEWLLSWGK